MGEDEYMDCPKCGLSIPKEIEGVRVEFCYSCGIFLELAEVEENGLEELETD